MTIGTVISWALLAILGGGIALFHLWLWFSIVNAAKTWFGVALGSIGFAVFIIAAAALDEGTSRNEAQAILLSVVAISLAFRAAGAFLASRTRFLQGPYL